MPPNPHEEPTPPGPTIPTDEPPGLFPPPAPENPNPPAPVRPATPHPVHPEPDPTGTPPGPRHAPADPAA